MNRRQCLTITSIFIVASAGCFGTLTAPEDDPPEDENDTDDIDDVGTGAWSPEVTIDGPPIGAGDTGTLDIHATDIGALSWSGTASDEEIGLEFGYDEATVIPDDYDPYLMYPPAWSWGEQQDVEVQIPFEIAEDTPPDDYDLSLIVKPAIDDDAAKEIEFSVTVT